jgi:hypothetical protein
LEKNVFPVEDRCVAFVAYPAATKTAKLLGIAPIASIVTITKAAQTFESSFFQQDEMGL